LLGAADMLYGRRREWFEDGDVGTVKGDEVERCARDFPLSTPWPSRQLGKYDEGVTPVKHSVTEQAHDQTPKWADQ